MLFYKAKYDAATPTRVQVNVPTNTDYMIGTELYVKGEKKDITAENVKISPSPKQYVDEVITLKYGADTEWATWNSSTHRWTILKPFTFKPHYYVKDASYKENTQYTHISYGDWYDKTSAGLATINSIRNSSGTVIANIKQNSTSDAQQYGLTAQFSLIQSMAASAYVSEFQIEAGMTIKAMFVEDWETSDLIFTNKVETGILSPDTTVNGIPAFTMKSLDAEADKLYEVEFKSEKYETNVALSANSEIMDFVQFSNAGAEYITTKEITLASPYIMVDGHYKENEEYTKYIELTGTSNGTNEINWLDGTRALTNILMQFNIGGELYKIAPVKNSNIINDGINPEGKPPFMIFSNTDYYKKVVIPTGTTITFTRPSTWGATYAKVSYFALGESYDYKFKLFINEDEQSYGDIDINGTTPAEVSAIVDDAIAAYDSQLSTVNLSGTFDDDSTFSYNFVIKN